jgi:PAS domain S-box-containing protein
MGIRSQLSPCPTVHPLISPSSSIQDVTKIVLQVAKELTGSKHGYVSEIDPVTAENVGHTLTEMMEDECAIPADQREATFPVGSDGVYGSLWGYSLNMREAFFSNSPTSHPASRGLPEGHTEIHRYLSVPVLLGDELVGQIALANPAYDYSNRDLDAVKRIAQYFAVAIQRKRVEDALKQAHDSLERRVAERTAELAATNAELHREINERTRAERAARLSEERFRAIFEAARDCVFMKDRSLKYVLVNPAMESLLGVPSAQIVGMTDYEMFGDKVGRHLEEVDLRVLEGQLIEEEHTRPVKSVPTTFLDIRAPMRNSADEIVGICGISRDITERRKILEAPETVASEYRSRSMRATFAEARLAAQSDSIVLLTGESGSGKDYLARFIHRNSRRAAGHFFSINCAAVPHELAESELFGHEPGAFTGAKGRARGLLELAEGGTLLLNEVGELPLALQAKLLTFFDTRTFTRVGGRTPISVSARIIAATNRDLEHQVQIGKFRADLYYRLNVMAIRVPPLRERIDDLPLLVRQLLAQLGTDLRLSTVPEIQGDMIIKLSQYHWPGNIRELRNVLERALIISKGERIELLPMRSDADRIDWILEIPFPETDTLDDITRRVKRSLVQEALDRSNGVRIEAARLLGISRHAMKRYIKSLGIESGFRT